MIEEENIEPVPGVKPGSFALGAQVFALKPWALPLHPLSSAYQ